MEPRQRRDLNQVLRKLQEFSSEARENILGKGNTFLKEWRQEREGRFDEASVWENQST